MKRLFSVEKDQISDFPANPLVQNFSPKSTKAILIGLALSVSGILICQQNHSELMAMTLESSSITEIVVEQQERLIQTYETAIATAHSEIKPLVSISAVIPAIPTQVIASEDQIEENKRNLMAEKERLRRRLAEISANSGTKELKKPSLNISSGLEVVGGAPMLSPNSERHESGLIAQIGFEPPAELAEVTGIIQPMLFKHKSSDKPVSVLNVLTKFDEAEPSEVKKLVREVTQLNDKVREAEVKSIGRDFKIVSGQIIQNLESSLGAIAKASSSGLAPELPTLVAKVYLPDSSDFGIVSSFVWPSQGVLTSRFGWRWGRIHQGIDIAAPIGTPIWAAAPGVIDYAAWNNGGYGNMVDIKHSDGTITRYAHLSSIYVKSGQPVNQSQVIGAMGSTGNSTGSHLHFEIRPKGRSAINPMNLLATAISRS